ncbi:hypothetical protein ASG43_13555 [Aureimonas sp. Leaf454]|nr:hypothetical protein ASG43_13555 [Aureimonas sp. Leaf454]
MGAMPAEAAASAEAHPSATPGSATVGSIRIEGGFVRAMLPGQKVGGGYLTIVNTGVDADRLLSVSTDAARRGSLHEMEMSGDVMRMRELAGGIDIPAGGSVSLSPGGTHLMFTEVDRPFATGTAVEVTLVFERAGPVSVVLPVAAPGAKAAGGIHDGHRP